MMGQPATVVCVLASLVKPRCTLLQSSLVQMGNGQHRVVCSDPFSRILARGSDSILCNHAESVYIMLHNISQVSYGVRVPTHRKELWVCHNKHDGCLAFHRQDATHV